MVITVNLYVHGNDAELLGKIASLVDAKLAPLSAAITSIAQLETAMTQQLDTLTSTVHDTEGVVDSAITLIGGLSAQIAALKDDPVALQALSDELAAKKDQLAAAVAANTPSP